MEVGGEGGQAAIEEGSRGKRAKSAVRGCLGRQPYFKVRAMVIYICRGVGGGGGSCRGIGTFK